MVWSGDFASRGIVNTAPEIKALPTPAVASRHAEMMKQGARCDICPLSSCAGPVGAEANAGAEFLAVGKHPGDQEVKHERPYVGPAGREITDVLATVGVGRGDVHWTNVIACQPPANDLGRVMARIETRNAAKKKAHTKARRAWNKAKQKASTQGIFDEPEPLMAALEPTPVECCRPRLMAEIEKFDRILTMGTVASKALLGRHANIFKVRGGMVEGALRYDDDKNEVTLVGLDEDTDVPKGYRRVRVLPVFEPAFVIRARRWSKAFHTDVSRAVAWFRDKLVFAEPEIVYHPKPPELAAFLQEPGAVYAYDVETDGIECLSASMRCIAIGTGDKVMVVGLRTKDADHRVKILCIT